MIDVRQLPARPRGLPAARLSLIMALTLLVLFYVV